MQCEKKVGKKMWSTLFRPYPKSGCLKVDVIKAKGKRVVYLCWQGRARNGIVGIAWQMGQVSSSTLELEDLSFENGLRNFLMDDELRRGSSSSNISCT